MSNKKKQNINESFSLYLNKDKFLDKKIFPIDGFGKENVSLYEIMEKNISEVRDGKSSLAHVMAVKLVAAYNLSKRHGIEDIDVVLNNSETFSFTKSYFIKENVNIVQFVDSPDFQRFKDSEDKISNLMSGMFFDHKDIEKCGFEEILLEILKSIMFDSNLYKPRGFYFLKSGSINDQAKAIEDMIQELVDTGMGSVMDHVRYLLCVKNINKKIEDSFPYFFHKNLKEGFTLVHTMNPDEFHSRRIVREKNIGKRLEELLGESRSRSKNSKARSKNSKAQLEKKNKEIKDIADQYVRSYSIKDKKEDIYRKAIGHILVILSIKDKLSLEDKLSLSFCNIVRDRLEIEEEIESNPFEYIKSDESDHSGFLNSINEMKARGLFSYSDLSKVVTINSSYQRKKFFKDFLKGSDIRYIYSYPSCLSAIAQYFGESKVDLEIFRSEAYKCLKPNAPYFWNNKVIEWCGNYINPDAVNFENLRIEDLFFSNPIDLLDENLLISEDNCEKVFKMFDKVYALSYCASLKHKKDI